MTLILASASETRAALLRNAGAAFEVVPSQVDEDALKAAHLGNATSLVDMLAEAKAADVAQGRSGDLVLGSDQILVFGQEVFSKARTIAEARAQFRRLRGGTHSLLSSAVLMRGDRLVWQGRDEARLTMRDFSDDFLDTYLARAGDAVLWSVGGYQIEGLGAQLFERVEGDYFSILGLPLFQVLAALRDEGELTV